MSELLLSVISLFITGILTLVGTTLNNYLKEKNINNKTLTYLDILSNIIIDSIKATQQIYVESLKEKDLFDKEAQEEALNITKNYIITNLPKEVLIFLESILPDLDSYINLKIESLINELKTDN